MDYAAEEKLCRLAHEVWLRVAAEPSDASSCAERADGGAADAGREVLAALHLRGVFALDACDGIV